MNPLNRLFKITAQAILIALISGSPFFPDRDVYSYSGGDFPMQVSEVSEWDMSVEADTDYISETFTIGREYLEIAQNNKDEDLFKDLDAEMEGSSTSGDDLFKDLDTEMKEPSPSDNDPFKDLDTEIEGAGSSESDPFKDLDMLSTEDSSKPAKKSKGMLLLKDLWDNFDGSLIPRTMYFIRNFNSEGDRDKRKFLIDYRLEGNTETKLKDYTFRVGGWVEGGSQRSTYAGISRFMRDVDNRRRHLEINLLSVSRSWDDFDLTIGRKSFQVGISTLYSPSDRIEPIDVNDPINPKRLGQWQCTLDYYINESTITLAALPFFSPDKLPHPSSRWAGKSGNATYEFSGVGGAGPGAGAGTNVDIKNTYPPNRYAQGFIRAKRTFKGWDIFLAGFHGFSKLPVLKSNPKTVGLVTVYEFEKEYPKVFNTSGGFSTTYKKFEFHGEGIYQYAYDGRDDNYLDYVLGFTYMVDDLAKKIRHDRIVITLEYGGEWLDKLQSNPNYEKSSEYSRRIHNNLMSRIQFKYNEDFNWNYGINYELPQDSWFQTVFIDYIINDNMTLKACGEFFDGKEQTSFERWEDNDRLILQMEYKF